MRGPARPGAMTSNACLNVSAQVSEGYHGTSPASGAGVDWGAKAIHYHAIAKHHASTWTTQTAGGLLGGHVSAYGKNGTFSLKYNLVFDRVLGKNDIF